MFISQHGLQASLVSQLVKNLPAMQETWVQFLGQEDPSEKELATNSFQYSCVENTVDRWALWAIVHEVARVGHNLVTKPPAWSSGLLTYRLSSMGIPSKMLYPELSGKWWSRKQHSCIYPPSNTENKERELTPQSVKISLKHFYQMHGKSNKYGTSKKEKQEKA